MAPESLSRGTVIPKGGAKGFDLYVKAIGSETLLRLTQHPSEWISPAWSPDGTQIAFHRMAGADTVWNAPPKHLRATHVLSLNSGVPGGSPLANHSLTIPPLY